MVAPSNKRKKVDDHGQVPLTKQESFTQVLEQLEAEEDATGGECSDQLRLSNTDYLDLGDHIETSGAWARPPLETIHVKTDSIGVVSLRFRCFADPMHSIPAD